MKRQLIDRLLHVALLAAITITTFSCSTVLEGPEDCCELKCELYLQLYFDSEEPISTRKFVSRGATRADLESYVNLEYERWRNVDYRGVDLDHATDVQRVVVRAFPIDDAGNIISKNNYETFTIDVSDNGFSGSITQKVLLSYDRYRIYAWADFATPGLKGLYYDTGDFASISFTGDYSGSNNNRVAYLGSTDVNLNFEEAYGKHCSAYIEMASPMARFLFITTDLNGFIEETISRRGSSRQDGSKATNDEDFNPDDYLLRVRYTGYIPSVFDIFYGRPVDSVLGVSFYSKLTIFNSDTALMGFDYIFVNGQSSSVDVVIDVYDLDEDGNPNDYLGSTPTMSIPIESGHYTVVYGEFLTSTNKGSVGINPDYDDIIYIHYQ